jgi:GT2 family glycosyltransferase
MDEHPLVGAVSPRLLNGDGLTVQVQGGGNKKQWYSTKPLAVKFITGAAFMIRREAYINVGGLDEKFFFYNEDLDWCTRILKKGWRIYYVPEAAIIHYGGKSTHFISKRAIVEGIKGGLYYNYKHYRWILPIYIPLLLCYCCLEIVFSLLKLCLFYKPRSSWERFQAFVLLIWIILSGSFR